MRGALAVGWVAFVFWTWCSAASVQAAALTWDGGGDGVSFNDLNNWNPNDVPDGADTCTIDSIVTAQLTANITVDDLILSKDGKVDLKGFVLTVEDDLQTSSVDGAGTCSILDTTGGGRVTMNTAGTTNSTIKMAANNNDWSISALEIDCSGDTIIVDGAGDKLTVTGTFTMTAGTIQFTNDNLFIVNNTVVWTGGTLQHGTSNVNTPATLSLPATTIPVGGTLLIRGAAGFIPTINGDLTLNGTLDFGADTLTISIAGHYVHNTGGTISNQASATFQMTGSGKEIRGTLAAGPTLQNLTIGGNITTNSTSMAVTVADQFKVNGGGTFNFSSGALTVSGNGDFTNNGTTNLNTGSFILADEFIDNGTFNAGSGTVTLNTVNNMTIAGTTNTHTFFNLTVNKSTGNRVDIDTGDTVVVNGLLDIQNGILRLNNNNDSLDLNGTPTSLRIANTANAEFRANTAGTLPVVTAAGDVTLLGAGNGLFNCDVGTVTFDGGTDSTLSLGTPADGSREFQNFNVSKTGTGRVLLNSGLRIEGSLTITDGLFVWGAGTVTLFGSFLNQALSVGEGVDATNAASTLTWSGTTTVDFDAGGDPLNVVNSNGTGTIRLINTLEVGAAAPAVTACSITGGSLNLNGYVLKVEPGERFEFNSTGTLTAAVAGSGFTRRGGAGTFTFELLRGTLDLSNLTFSYGDSTGMNINPTTTTSVTFTNFDGLRFTNGTTTHLRLGANCRAANFTDTTWTGHSYDYNTAGPDIPSADTGNPFNITTAATGTGTVTLNAFAGDGAGNNVAATAETNDADAGTVINWDDTQILITGSFDGATDVSIVSTESNGVSTVRGTYTPNSSPYSFNVTPWIAAGQLITIFYEAGGPDAALVTIATGQTMSGLNLAADEVRIHAGNAAAMTHALMDPSGSPYDSVDDADIPYTITSATDAITLRAGFMLRVLAGQTYTPGGGISWVAANAGNTVTVAGTFNLNANTVTSGTALTIDSTGTCTLTTGTGNFDRDDAAADITVDGILNLGAGGTLNVGDDFILNSTGTFNAGTGTVAMRTARDDGDLMGTKNTITFYNLTINKTTGTDTVNVEQGDVIVVNGLLTLTLGQFLVNATETLDLNGTPTSLSIADSDNARFDISGTGAILSAAGDITCGANGRFDVDGGTLTFDGATNSTVNTGVPGANRDFFNVVVDKSGAGQVILASDIDVNGSFTINGGLFDSATFDITLAGSFASNVSGAAGFDFSDPATDFTFDGAAAQNITSNGDAFNRVTMSGTGSRVLLDGMAVGVGLAGGDSLTVTAGSMNLNGKTLSVQSGTRFVFSSNTADPDGALRSSSTTSTLTRAGAGTWTMLMEEGQIDVTGLNVSFTDANGFNVVPAGGGVTVLNFDRVVWSSGTTLYLRLSGSPTFTDTLWSDHNFPAGAVNVRTVAGSTGGPITMLNAVGAGAGEANDDDLGIGIDWVIGVTLQGAFDGTTDVTWARNGVVQGTYTTDASPFTFSGIINLLPGDIISVYYEGGVNIGAVVTTSTGGNLTDLDISTNRLRVRNDNGGTGLTNANLDTGHTGDADVPWTDGGGAALTVAGGIALEVMTGHSYAPGGTVTLQGAGVLQVEGTATLGGAATLPSGVVIGAGGVLDAGAQTIACSGSWTNNRGTAGFVEGTSLVRLNSTAQVTTNEAFNNLEVAGGTPSVAAARTVSCANFTMNAGTSFTLNDDVNYTVSGSFTWSAGTISAGTSAGNDLGVWSTPGFTVPGGLTWELFGTAATSVTVNGDLTVNGVVDFNANVLTLILTGNWVHNTGGSLAGSGSSTVRMTGAGTELRGTLAGGTVFQNLSVSGSVVLNNAAMQVRTQGNLAVLSGGTFGVGTGTVDVDTDLLITGTLNADSGLFTLGRSFTNDGTFNAGSSSFTLDTAAAGTVGGTANNHTFSALTIGKTAAADLVDIESGDTVTVGGALTINAGTLRLNDTEVLDLNGSPTSLTIANTADAVLQATAGTPTIRAAGNVTLTGGAGAAGRINLDTGTIEFDGTAAATLSPGTASNGNRDFFNVRVNKSAAGSVTLTNGLNLDMDGSLSIDDGNLTFGSNTVTLAGAFTNSAAGGEGFDATGTTVTLDGTGTQTILSGGDAFTTLNQNGTGTAELGDTFTGTTVTVNSGAWNLNGKTMRITAGGTFLHTSSSANPNGAFKATVAGSTVTSVSGTLAFTVEQGQIDVTSLAFSRADANGFFINPAAAADVDVLNFDGVAFTSGTTTHVKIGAACAAATFTDVEWVSHSYDYNLADPNIPPTNTGNPFSVTSVAGSTGTITLIGFDGTGAGSGVAAAAESNDSDAGTIVNWDDSQRIITGSFDGTTNVRIVSTDAGGVSTVRGDYTTDSSPYSFNVTSWIAAGQLLTIFYNDDAAGNDAVVVTIATGLTMSGLGLQAGEARIHDGNAAAMTNPLMDPSDSPYDNVDDGDIPYTVTSASDTLTITAGTALRILSGQAYTPSGPVTWSAVNAGNDVSIDGTMNVGTETIDRIDACSVPSSGKLDVTAAGTVVIRNGLTANGVVEGGSGTIRVGTDFTLNTTGTFTAETGTVELNLSTNAILGGTKNTIAFNNLTVNKGSNANTVDIEDNDTITVAGAFTLTKGRFILAASEVLDIDGTGASLTVANDGNAWLDVTGAGASVICAGSVSVGANGQFDLDGGTLTLDGSTATTLSTPAPSSSQDLNHLVINKSGAGSVAASSSLDINGNLTISDGTLVFGANTLNVAGNFTNSAAGAEGFDATNAAASVVFDGAGTQQITSGGDAFNLVTCSGTGTVQLMDACTVGTAVGAGTSLAVTRGLFRMNGQTLSIQPGTTFLFSSSTASPNGALRATAVGATITRSGGAGTFTMTVEEGQLDISSLNFSFADASGFNIAPAAGQNGVNVLTFDSVVFTNGTTRHMTIDDGPSLTLTDATWAGCTFDATAATNIRTADNSTQNTAPTTTVTMFNASGAGAGEGFDDDTGANRITIDWTVNVTLQGAFDGTSDVRWARNGTVRDLYTTNASPFLFTGISDVVAGDLLTIYYEGSATKACVVVRATGTSITNIDLTDSTVTVRNDNGGGITNADLSTADTGSADVPYNVSGGALTVDTGIDLEVPTGYAFTPGGAVTLQGANGDVRVRGTLTLGGTMTVPGSLTVSAGTLDGNGQTATVTGLATVSGGTYTTGGATQTLGGGMTLSAGSFTGGAGIVDANGAVTLSGGTMTCPSGSLTVSGDFTRSSAATFSNNGGSVSLDGTAGTQTVGGTGDIPFNNLTLANGATRQFGDAANGGRLYSVANTFSWTGGGAQIGQGALTDELRLSLAAQTVTIPTGVTLTTIGSASVFNVGGTTGTSGVNILTGTLETAGTGGISCGGAWVNNAAFTANSGTVTMSGGAQAIQGSSSTVFNNLTIAAGSTTTVNPNSGINTDVSATLTVNSAGLLVLADSRTLRLGTAAASGTASIAGTLRTGSGASNRPTITAVAAGFRHTFSVTATGVVDINGLIFERADTNGFNVADGATWTTFSNAQLQNAVSGGRHVTVVRNAALTMECPGCSFDNSYTIGSGRNVRITDGNGGSDVVFTFDNLDDATNGNGRGDGTVATRRDDDDDADLDNIPDAAGAVVQWIYVRGATVGGTRTGYPISYYNLSNFSLQGLISAFNDVNGANDDQIVISSTTGATLRTFTLANALGNIVGTPWYDNLGGQQVIYVGTTAGHVLKLWDNFTTIRLVFDIGGAGNPLNDGSIITAVTSPVQGNFASLIFFGATRGGVSQLVWLNIGTRTQLNGAYAGGATLTVDSTVGFPGSVATANTAFVLGDDFTYTGTTATTFTGVAGLAARSDNDPVALVTVSGSRNTTDPVRTAPWYEFGDVGFGDRLHLFLATDPAAGAGVVWRVDTTDGSGDNTNTAPLAAVQAPIVSNYAGRIYCADRSTPTQLAGINQFAAGFTSAFTNTDGSGGPVEADLWYDFDSDNLFYGDTSGFLHGSSATDGLPLNGGLNFPNQPDGATAIRSGPLSLSGNPAAGSQVVWVGNDSGRISVEDVSNTLAPVFKQFRVSGAVGSISSYLDGATRRIIVTTNAGRMYIFTDEADPSP